MGVSGRRWRQEFDDVMTDSMHEERSAPLSVDAYFATRLTYSEDRERLWRLLADHLRRHIPDSSCVLELGAGYCHFINNVRAREKHALDISPVVTEHAGTGVTTHVGPCTDLSAFGDGSVDVVFASNLFEHLTRSDCIEALAEVRRILRIGGRLILVQPNFRFCYRTYFDDYTHREIYTDRSMRDLVQVAGLVVTELKPKFLPFSIESRLPVWSWGVRLYLRSPVKPFAGQMLVVAEKR